MASSARIGGRPETESAIPVSNLDQRLKFIEKVRETVASVPGLFEQFQGLIDDFSSEIISMQDTKNAMQIIFEDFPELISGFNTIYLRQDDTTKATPPSTDAGALKFESALNYLETIHRTYASQPQVYTAFLDVMKRFKSQELTTPDVIRIIKQLFKDSPDLIVGFNFFLPPAHKIDVNDISSNENEDLSKEIDGRDATGSKEAEHKSTAPASSELIFPGAGRTQQKSFEIKSPALMPFPQRNSPQQPVKFESALAYLDALKSTFSTQPQIYNAFLDIMKGFKSQELDTVAVVREVKLLLKGYPDLVAGFNVFLPLSHQIKPDDDEMTTEENEPSVSAIPSESTESPAKAARAPEFGNAVSYVKEVKMRFASNPEIYKEFLNILHDYHSTTKTLSHVVSSVNDLFQDHPDLIEQFKIFIPDNKTN